METILGGSVADKNESVASLAASITRLAAQLEEEIANSEALKPDITEVMKLIEEARRVLVTKVENRVGRISNAVITLRGLTATVRERAGQVRF